MAKEKSVPDTVSEEKEYTFICSFCGEARPLSELTLQTRFFPVLTACRACERAMQSLRIADQEAETEEAADEEAPAEEPEEDMTPEEAAEE